MPEDAQGGEKTEQPTPKKLADARNEGQVAVSPEVNTALLLLLGLIAIGLCSPWLFQVSAVSVRTCILEDLGRELTITSAMQTMLTLATPFAAPTAVLVGLAFAAGLTASIGQVGLQASLKPLIPKFNRVNPLTGLQRLFGMRALMRFAVNLVKLILILSVAWLVLRQDIPRLAYLDLDVGKRLATDASLIWWLGLKLAAVLGLIALADLIYQRWQHTQDLMMTKQEVKEEMKQADGDPLVKSRIRQLQRQMAQRRMMQEVPKADVVITNPTHVAVALKYDAGAMAAPIVLAKGYDEVAQRIKAIAAEHNITMVENVTLARALAKEVDIGKPVPTKWYQAVAEVLAMVYRLKKAG
ncbi:MAG: flagellar biosynthesis protein FlhB [Planctomycetes bacterium]|nr:flagellar biosynthesis protein FlhB [Planctomycetota bacterium]